VLNDLEPDLLNWLDELGLSPYAGAFAYHRIEYSILSDLTDYDLKSIGIPLGHRKIMLKAIRPRIITAPTLRPRDAELRQITVMFCDLVGSTQLSAKIEPEDLKLLLEAYRNACSAAIRRYDGRVSGYFGDGVVAFFGWPRAHEDDAVRAVGLPPLK
jgi:hypothetical protein